MIMFENSALLRITLSLLDVYPVSTSQMPPSPTPTLPVFALSRCTVSLSLAFVPPPIPDPPSLFYHASPVVRVPRVLLFSAIA